MLGGIVGILTLGYAYYWTHQQHPWLIPLGTIAGCSLGYFIGNVQVIIRKTKMLAAPIAQMQKDFLTQKDFCAKFLQTKGKEAMKWVVIIDQVCNFIVDLPFKILGFAYRLLFGHPVRTALTVELLASALVGILAINGLAHFLPPIHRNSTSGGEVITVFMDIILAFMVLIPWGNKAFDITDDGLKEMSNFYTIWESWSRNKVAYVLKAIRAAVLRVVFFTTALLLAAVCYSPFLLYGLILVLAGCFMAFGLFMAYAYIGALRYYGNAMTFVTTLACVTGSYILFHNQFGNQLLIWCIALLTGCSASVITVLMMKPLTKKYIYLNPGRWFNFTSTKMTNSMGRTIAKPFNWFDTNFMDRAGTALDFTRFRELIAYF